jgi:hypothetical protein
MVGEVKDILSNGRLVAVKDKCHASPGLEKQCNVLLILGVKPRINSLAMSGEEKEGTGLVAGGGQGKSDEAGAHPGRGIDGSGTHNASYGTCNARDPRPTTQHVRKAHAVLFLNF